MGIGQRKPGNRIARQIIQRHSHDVLFVPVNDEGVSLDMDCYLAD